MPGRLNASEVSFLSSLHFTSSVQGSELDCKELRTKVRYIMYYDEEFFRIGLKRRYRSWDVQIERSMFEYKTRHARKHAHALVKQ